MAKRSRTRSTKSTNGSEYVIEVKGINEFGTGGFCGNARIYGSVFGWILIFWLSLGCKFINNMGVRVFVLVLPYRIPFVRRTIVGRSPRVPVTGNKIRSR